MAATLNESCPLLPLVEEHELLDSSILSRHGSSRDADFYYDALRYGQYLWRHGHAGRALLSITRALYADVSSTSNILKNFPLPYAAIAWIVRHHPSDDFPGNPRLSFQHQAHRLRGARKELRAARAWAVWALVCKIRPHLPSDPTCPEPTIQEITDLLDLHAHPNESGLWLKLLDDLKLSPR